VNGEVLPDVLAPGLCLVFCGTAAGAASARRGAYYAGPGNRFWPVLHATGLTPRLLAPEEFRLLPLWGIGLTDLAKRASGADASLPPGSFDPEGLRRRLRAVRPGCLAFNGKAAAGGALGCRRGAAPAYGPQPPAAGWPPVWVLPSTSGAARGHWDPAPWFALAAAVGHGADASAPAA
jgi:TDG/mug DNA glycosylase family protein